MNAMKTTLVALGAVVALTAGVSAQAQRSRPDSGVAASQQLPILKEIGIER